MPRNRVDEMNRVDNPRGDLKLTLDGTNAYISARIALSESYQPNINKIRSWAWSNSW